MPKMKTDSGAAKRFKITGPGRLRRRQATATTCSRRSRPPDPPSGARGDVAAADVKAVKRLLGI